MALLQWTMQLQWMQCVATAFLLLVLYPCRTVVAEGQRQEFAFSRPHYKASVVENTVGKTYLQTVDGSPMGIRLFSPSWVVRYRFLDGVDSKMFRLDQQVVGDFSFLRIRPKGGRTEGLNREQQDTYRLSVRATLENDPQERFATTEVVVSVLDSNDLHPLFEQSIYDVEIPEDFPVHSSVLRVFASDADAGMNSEVYYSIRQKIDTFAIHPTTGVISLMKKLNYIDNKLYEFEVVAQDRGPSLTSVPRLNSAMVNILVTEVNNYAPMIEVQRMPIVVEHGKMGTVYAVLSVTDKDFGDNGRIDRVDIVGGDSDRYFQVVPVSQSSEFRIQLAKPMERSASIGRFNLTVMAKDKGKPQRNSTLNVVLKLWDGNEFAPEFERRLYNATASECLPVGYPLLMVKARDKDDSIVEYSLVAGNDLGWLSINTRSGVISVASRLDADIVTELSVTVVAEDQAASGSRRRTQAIVKVLLTDCNDNAPVFDSVPTEEIPVDENAAIGSPVYQLKARDSDRGDNGFVSYSLVNANTVPFIVDQFSGQITTSQLLDYESMKRSYKLRVRASDWGEPFRRETEVTVRVKIADVNDNVPEFERLDCIGYLSREAPVGTELVVMSAIDLDIGNIVSYRIQGGNGDNCFDIVPSEGVARTRCDFRQQGSTSGYSIITIASDGLHDSVPATLNITLLASNRHQLLAMQHSKITCRDTNVAAKLSAMLKGVAEVNKADDGFDVPVAEASNLYEPSFVADISHKIFITEGITKVGEKIAAIRATDPDVGFGGYLMYVIGSGDDMGTFRIDPYSGDLYVLSELDREMRDHYLLNITVADMGTPPRYASMMLEIDVEDINDNAPEFEKSSYSLYIPEEAQPNSTVMSVTAFDRDLGPNAEIVYSLEGGNRAFRIDARTGTILVNGPLDRETVAVYDVIVKATDRSPLNPLSTAVPVKIKIYDTNDNPPIFQPDFFAIHVPEDIPISSVLLTVTAIDPDDTDRSSVRYNLVSDATDMFDIDRLTGAIRLKAPLDYETRQTYNLTVRARDTSISAMSSQCTVIVHVTDVTENFYAPVFEDFVYSLSVTENQPAGTLVGKVKATDHDEYNIRALEHDYRVTYSIRGGSGLGLFSIDNEGAIHTRHSLDRETQSSYWLTVYATDGGTVPLSASVEVYVLVRDDNDNPPAAEPLYYVNVAENTSPGVPVFQPASVESGSRITFAITGGNPQGFFEIDSKTGVISTTNRALDRETMEEHTLEVTLTDSISLLTSVTRVVITVTDENDEIPMFLESPYRVSVPEMSASAEDVPLFRVVAMDPDVGANGDIDYAIASGRASSHFKIHPKTGVITSQREFIKGSNFELRVKASDNGSPARSATVQVLISVVAQGPNHPMDSSPPVFTASVFRKELMESSKPGALVFMLTAEDKDGDLLWYSIKDGNVDDAFSIDTTHGQGRIILARRIDRETLDHYNLTVSVTDGTHVALCQVLVTVLDVNDNRPAFTSSVYYVNVTESEQPQAAVFTVQATDRDEGDRLFYSLYAFSDQQSKSRFTIDSVSEKSGGWKGVISTIGPLHRDHMSRHELVVMVRDDGSPAKHSFCRVLISVMDANNHAPEFIGDSLVGQVDEGAAPGTVVLKLMAFDRDTSNNGRLTYEAVSGTGLEQFQVDTTSGVVSLAHRLPDNYLAIYGLLVRVSDFGTPALSSTATVSIKVTSGALVDHIPTFTDKILSIELAENVPLGTYVTTVRAVAMSMVTYELVTSSDATAFVISPSTGVIVTQVELDYETRQVYNMTVRASVSSGKYADLALTVHIADINDNQPVLIGKLYVGHIREDSPSGAIVLTSSGQPLTIRATDADTSENGKLSFTMIGSDAMKALNVDAATGTVRLINTIDREETSSYEFYVSVSDGGVFPLHSADVAKVVVLVDDVNDCSPTFNAPSYTADLILPTVRGVIILTASAVDSDKDASLIYTLLSNGSSTFGISSHTGDIYVDRVPAVWATRYDLLVQVSDGVHQAIQAVTVKTVQPSQSDGLKFTQAAYEMTVGEDNVEVKVLGVVQTVGREVNEQVRYTILNPVAEFNMTPASGVLRTTGVKLDREAVAVYTLLVEARDRRTPPNVAYAKVIVSVADINDNTPTFYGQPYHMRVTSDAAFGHVVGTVMASDDDEGRNAAIDFSVVGGVGVFAVGAQTGQLVVAGAVGPQGTEHKITVQAADRGVPSRKSVVEVTVLVTSETAPLFTSSVYNASVREDAVSHTPVILLQADSVLGHKVVYTLVGGDPFDQFYVTFDTGALLTRDILDFEFKKSYELIVRATDAINRTFTQALVIVSVEDVNDHPPVFERGLYEANVMESVAVGSNVLRVKAKDDDTGVNSMLHYSLQASGNFAAALDYVWIDSYAGTLYTKRPLNYEVVPTIAVVVVAVDSGTPARTGSALVTLSVIDINDHVPTFESSSHDVTLSGTLQSGQFVTKVIATDDDTVDRGMLRYAITGGNEERAFVIDDQSGIVTISVVKKPRYFVDYIFNVSVTDGVFVSYSRVRVTALPFNNYAPFFSSGLYEVALSATARPGDVLTTLVAVDNDEGRFGELIYDIVDGDGDQLFDLDQNTGELKLKAVLGHGEQGSMHQWKMTVTATDGGGATIQTAVVVTLTSENTRLLFEQREYATCVASTTSQNVVILEVQASVPGKDLPVTYSIADRGGDYATALALFTVNATSGRIAVKSSLPVSGQLVQFFVRASVVDSIIPYVDVPVDVYITNDQLHSPPVFLEKTFVVEVPETLIIGSIVAHIQAQHALPLVYSLVSGFEGRTNNPAFFDINEHDGNILLTRALDREDIAQYRLTLRAEVKDNAYLAVETVIIVKVTDINDNKPVFVADQYNIVIPENVAIGTSVVQVVALDKDSGASGRVSYRLAETTITAGVFVIDTNSGWLRVVGSVDRETRADYSLEVIAWEDETLERHSARVTVKVTLLDQNDVAPQFALTQYQTAVNEDAQVDTVVLSLSANDLDTLAQSRLTYHITAGDSLVQFGVRSSGELYVLRPLDRELKAEHRLTVLVTDGVAAASATVIISILDANDHAPICRQVVAEATLTEDVSQGTHIVKVEATDADDITTPYGRVEYELVTPSDFFSVQQKTGMVVVKAAVDRETSAEHVLLVRAKDGGGLSCNVTVHITLTDINDNTPIFIHPRLEVTVLENSPVNTLVTRVQALDADAGENQKVRYNVLSSRNPFDDIVAIDSVTGIVSLTRPLDREARDQHAVIIVATDMGSPSNSGQMELVIRVLDVNDNAPVFSQREYDGAVAENTPAGSLVLQLHATSMDEGVNAHISYSIIDGNADGYFDIAAESGELVTTVMLDYEETRQFVLTVQAVDGGQPPLTGTAIVQITVIDENDHAPQFANSAYVVMVIENTDVGSQVMKVEAGDRDSGVNGQVTYRIASGDPEGHFTINQLTGTLQLARSPDFESVENYTLLVVAEDKGIPSLSSTGTISVRVRDVNDNAPKFSQDTYEAVVQVDGNGYAYVATTAEEELGYPILVLVVTDADGPSFGAPFHYDIVDGNHDNKFRISKDGYLSTASQFDKAVKDTYQLTVRVFDNADSPLFSDAVVTVRVVEESGYPPLISPLNISILVFDGRFVGGIIGRLKAISRYPHDFLTYSVVSSSSKHRNPFSVQQLDGTLLASDELETGVYTVNISVTNGRQTAYSEVIVTLRDVEPSAIDNSVIVRLGGLVPEEFILDLKSRFLRVLGQELGAADDGVMILSVQPSAAPQHTAAGQTRSRRDTTDEGRDLDVVLAARRPDNNFFKRSALKKKIQSAIPALEAELDISVERVFTEKDTCEPSMCKEGTCEASIDWHPELPALVVTEADSFMAASFSLIIQCRCNQGYGGMDCSEAVDVCRPNPCPEPSVCVSDGLSYDCQCPPGIRCSSLPGCVGDKCPESQPVTLSGMSYIRWQIAKSMERRLYFSLELRTIQESAVLLYAAGNTDYFILEVDRGVVQVRFNHGGGESVVRVDQLTVTDGRWHSVVVERLGQRAAVSVDGKASQEANAPGSDTLLHLSANELTVGGLVGLAEDDVQQGFKGCLRNVKVEGIALPLEGSNAIGSLVALHDIEFHCDDKVYSPGVCSSHPCLNGGSCIPTDSDQLSYRCHCRSRYTGARCEVDRNPCAGKPCLSGGTCESLAGGDFVCHCKGSLKGKRCERASVCEEGLCKNGGSCQAGVSGVVCDCQPGYEGVYCEANKNECLSSPCHNDGVCMDTHGSFRCNCTAGTSGDLCQFTLPQITSTEFPFTPPEIAIIIGCCVGVLLIGVIIAMTLLLCRRRVRQKKALSVSTVTEESKRLMKTGGKAGDPSIVGMGPVGSNGSRHRPPPPQLFDRPVSYTPGTMDAVNLQQGQTFHFDTANNYGSAGDELESVGTLPVHVPRLTAYQTGAGSVASGTGSLNSVKRRPHQSSPSSNASSRNKLSFDTNNPNLAENCLSNPKEQNKIIPIERNPLHLLELLPVGTTSLGTMASQDGLGYHWDTSDWCPERGVQRNSMAFESSDIDESSPMGTLRSNVPVDMGGYESTDYPDELTENEESEREDDHDDDMPADIGDLDVLDYNSFLQRCQELGLKNGEKGGAYNKHVNAYLPKHELDSNRNSLVESDDKGGASAQPDYSRMGTWGYGMKDAYGTINSVRDDKSIGGGYTSINASCSDVSGICGIEDSDSELDEAKPALDKRLPRGKP